MHRPVPTKRDLATALDDLLAGHTVATPRTDAVGCKISHLRKSNENSPVNYSKHVARILRDRCVACHREGEIAPFSLANFKEASGWADMIDEVVQGGRMPPWHASPAFGKFSNDCRLNDDERTIATWVAAGAPEGDPKDLPKPAHYVAGWRIPAPDLVIALPRTVKIPAEGTMPYQNFMIDPKLKEDVWVRASQVRQGTRRLSITWWSSPFRPGVAVMTNESTSWPLMLPECRRACCRTASPSLCRPARS